MQQNVRTYVNTDVSHTIAISGDRFEHGTRSSQWLSCALADHHTYLRTHVPAMGNYVQRCFGNVTEGGLIPKSR